MKTKSKTKRFLKLKVTIPVVVIMLLISLGKAPGHNSTPASKNIKSAVDSNDRRQGEIQRKITDSASGNFRVSLEMKENVDFLLSPAILVQEVVSEDTVITYPSE